MTTTLRKEVEFANLVKEAKSCTLCERMNSSVRVIGPASGSIDAPIIVVGEAPGRLGADASAIPFHGDKAGDNFETLLDSVGLSRHNCFITNAALCNPRDENGNNATPSKAELRNCSNFLKRQIDLVNPKIVVTLGAQALYSLKAIEDHDIELSLGVRQAWDWYGRKLIVLYHPGQRAMVHRSFFNQLADYRFLAETFFRGERERRSPTTAKPTSEAVLEVAKGLACRQNGVSYFGLHKLFYLAECEFYRRHGKRMTSAYIVRQKEGPYVFEMQIKKLKKAFAALEIWEDRGRLLLRCRDASDLFSFGNPDETGEIVEFVSSKYGQCTDAELKRIVYLTAPMRHLLRQEKGRVGNTFNRPIDFSLLSK